MLVCESDNTDAEKGQCTLTFQCLGQVQITARQGIEMLPKDVIHSKIQELRTLDGRGKQTGDASQRCVVHDFPIRGSIKFGNAKTNHGNHPLLLFQCVSKRVQQFGFHPVNPKGQGPVKRYKDSETNHDPVGIVADPQIGAAKESVTETRIPETVKGGIAQSVRSA